MIFLASLSARNYAIEPPMIETTNKQTAIPKKLNFFFIVFSPLNFTDRSSILRIKYTLAMSHTSHTISLL